MRLHNVKTHIEGFVRMQDEAMTRTKAGPPRPRPRRTCSGGRAAPAQAIAAELAALARNLSPEEDMSYFVQHWCAGWRERAPSAACSPSTRARSNAVHGEPPQWQPYTVACSRSRRWLLTRAPGAQYDLPTPMEELQAGYTNPHAAVFSSSVEQIVDMQQVHASRTHTSS